ncbi:MAG TPA: pilus assembly protein [Methylorubrum populi]|uniref:Pilus assembly protein n=1 Tax=Methylorubrum populi TaxID=223967 RepID=A0A921E4V1_9HYPH|nr:pilus assembly protein [Methylorubrum populi]
MPAGSPDSRPSVQPGVPAGKPPADLVARARSFRRSESGIAALEFALVLPTFLFVLLSSAQLIMYVNAVRRVELIAYSISQMISQATPPAGQTIAKINATDLHFSFDSTLVLFPYVMADAYRRSMPWHQNISINYAGIKFTPKSSSCPTGTDMSSCYNGNVVWTSTGTFQPAGGDNYRPCGQLQLPADDNAPPNRAYLPRSAYGPASLVVIDVVFNFRPTFGSGLVPAIRIARSAYVLPRYATLVDYDLTNNDGIAVKCLGM